MMKLMYMLAKYKVKVNRWVKENFNPFYKPVKHIVDIDSIVKELHLHETRILKEHQELVDLNSTTIEADLNKDVEYKNKVLEVIKNSDILDKHSSNIKDIVFVTYSHEYNSDKIVKKTLFLSTYNGRRVILKDMNVVDFLFRTYLYNMCLAESELKYDNCYYRKDNSLIKLSSFFKMLIVELNKEHKDLLNTTIMTLDLNDFNNKYHTRYPDYISKHIIDRTKFKTIY